MCTLSACSTERGLRVTRVPGAIRAGAIGLSIRLGRGIMEASRCIHSKAWACTVCTFGLVRRFFEASRCLDSVATFRDERDEKPSHRERDPETEQGRAGEARLGDNVLEFRAESRPWQGIESAAGQRASPTHDQKQDQGVAEQKQAVCDHD